jgi:hypothetical protein
LGAIVRRGTTAAAVVIAAAFVVAVPSVAWGQEEPDESSTTTEPIPTTTTTEAPPEAPARSVTVTAFDCESITVTGSGWEQTEATVEVAVPPSEGGESLEDLVAGPVQVFPDAQGNIPPTTLRFKSTPRDGSYAAVVMVDGLVREQSAGFTLTGCGAPPQAPQAPPAAPVTEEPDFTG